MDVSPAHAPTGELAKRVSTVATAAATFLVVGLVLLSPLGGVLRRGSCGGVLRAANRRLDLSESITQSK